MDEYLKLTSWTGDSDPRSGQFTFKQYKEEQGHYVVSKNPGLDYWRSSMSGDFMSFHEIPVYQISATYAGRRARIPGVCWIPMTKGWELQYLK
ncbi:hypothetical protein SLA2020_435000 [Shorea laevis]